MLFISHDLELARAVSDRTAVMYAGEIVETQSSNLLHSEALHPYTAALLAARPSIEKTAHRLPAIPGRAIPAFEAPPGCSFQDRCPHVIAVCRQTHPPLERFGQGSSRCWRTAELRDTRVLRAVGRT